jgi:RNA polymerase sigma factor (sigma-70 family)
MSKVKARSGGADAEQSFLESFLACKPLMSRLIGRIVRPHEIEDIVQEAFANSFAASRKQKINNPRAFMLKTARNIALNQLKGVNGANKMEIQEFIDEQFEDLEKSIEEQYESEERFLFFCRAVARLPASCRRVFVLIKVYGLSNREVAEYLNLHSSTVEKHVAKGMLEVIGYMRTKDHAEAKTVKKTISTSRVSSGE